MKMAKVQPLNNEIYRLYTFNKQFWEQFSGRPCASSLARCGFSYNEHTSSVICFCCQFSVTLSQLNEDCYDMHKTMSPHCAVAHQTKPNGANFQANLSHSTDPLIIHEKYKNNPAVADDQVDAQNDAGLLGLRRAYKLSKAAVSGTQSAYALDVLPNNTKVTIDRANPDFDELWYELNDLETYH